LVLLLVLSDLAELISASGQTLARQLTRAGLPDADVTLIDSLTAQKRLTQAGFGLALVPESSVREELRQGVLVALDIPLMQTTIPITAVYRRNGYLSAAAKALLALLTAGQTRSIPEWKIPAAQRQSRKP
jgi:DNA-binding transcriptional LysR family regulator